jgi:hypothetical protein
MEVGEWKRLRESVVGIRGRRRRSCGEGLVRPVDGEEAYQDLCSSLR